MAKEYIIPIFIPHAGCKRRCVFCNEFSSTGFINEPNYIELERTYYDYLKIYNNHNKKYIAFYGSTFTGLKLEKMKFYLDWAQTKINNNEIFGIRFSTSPEELSLEIIKMLKNYNINLIELGVQSFNENVLKKSFRPNNLKNIYSAISLLENNNLIYGIHLMTNLPGSNHEKDIESGIIASKLNISTLRIHQTIVLKNTILENIYKKGLYFPDSIETSVEKITEIYIINLLNKKNIIRVGYCLYGKEKNNIVAGPFHENFGELVKTEVIRKTLNNLIIEKLNIPNSLKNSIIGYKKKNLDLIKQISFNKDDKIIYNNTIFNSFEELIIKYVKI